MSKDQVRQIMGKPYRREAESNLEWWLYQTENQTMFATESEYRTPLLFKDSELIGWGKNFWTSKEQKYDITIDQKDKQE